MTLKEAREILTAPRPEYKKRTYGDNVYYSWKTSVAPMVVELLKKAIPSYSSIIAEIPPDYQELLTVDDKRFVHFYELRFGQADADGYSSGYTLTNTGNPTEVFIGVLGAVEQFQKEYSDFTAIEYTASGRGRVKSYNLLTKLMTANQNLPYHIEGEEGSNATYFVFFTDSEHTRPFGSPSMEDEEDEEDEEVTEYMRSGNCNAERVSPNRISVFIFYYLLEKTGEDGEWEESEGPFDSTEARVVLSKIGKGIPISDESTEFLYDLKKFNPMNGTGILVDYVFNHTPEDADDRSVQTWRNADDGGNLDDYEVYKYLADMLKPEESLDYIIVKSGKDLDSYAKDWLENYFDFRRVGGYYSNQGLSYDVMEDWDNGGVTYNIYYRLRYDYSKSAERMDGQWSSLPSQRRHDRQTDLPYGF